MKVKVVWSSKLTSDMLSHLSSDEKEELYEQLNDAVMEVCSSYEVE